MTTPKSHFKISQQLRSIGVFVDEPDPGCFYWVVHESTEDATIWLDISASEESFSTWLEAFESGNEALLRLVVDKKTGPLSENANENVNHVGKIPIGNQTIV